jgi:hypothetical protein
MLCVALISAKPEEAQHKADDDDEADYIYDVVHAAFLRT